MCLGFQPGILFSMVTKLLNLKKPEIGELVLFNSKLERSKCSLLKPYLVVIN